MPSKKSPSKPKPAAKQETGGGRSAATWSVVDTSGFALRFRSLLEKNGQSQKHVATALAIAESAIVNYKNGRIPKAEELLRIARFFGVSMEWLLTGDNPPTA